MHKNKILITGLTLLLTLSLFIIAPTNSKAQEKITLNFQTALSMPGMVEGQKQVIKKFEETYPNIDVNMSVVPWAQHYDKIVTSIAAGAPPDVIIAGTGYMLTWSKMGGLVPVDDIIKELGGEDNFDQAHIKETKRAGHYWAVPLWTNSHLLYYRKDWFREKGIKEPPETWSELYEVAKKLTEPNKDRWGFGFPVAKTRHPQKDIWSIMLGFGATVFDSNLNVNFDTPETVEAYKFAAKLARETSPPGVAGMSREDILEMYRAGQIGMIETAPYFADQLRENQPNIWEKTGVAIVPKGPRGRGQWKGTVSLCVGDTKHVEAAKKFISFWMKDKNYIPWLLHMPLMMNPTKLSTRKSPDYNNAKVFQQEDLARVHEVILKSLPFAKQGYMYYGPSTLAGAIGGSRIIPDVLQMILTGKKTPKEAVVWGEKQILEKKM